MKTAFSLTALAAALGHGSHDHCERAGRLRARSPRLSLTDTTLTATVVPAGQFTPPAGGPPGAPPPQPVNVRRSAVSAAWSNPPFASRFGCPRGAAWNGRYQAVGGGGFAGVISYSAMVPAVQAGYVTSSTDTGHVAPDVEWLGDPDCCATTVIARSTR